MQALIKPHVALADKQPVAPVAPSTKGFASQPFTFDGVPDTWL